MSLSPEQALVAAATPEAARGGDRKKFYEAFLLCGLVLPGLTEDSLGPRARTIMPGETVAFEIAPSNDGTSWLPAFTSEEALLRWRPDGGPTLRMSGPDAAGAVLALKGEPVLEGLVINPADPNAVGLNRWELASLAQGTFPDPNTIQHLVLREPTNVQIGMPAKPWSRKLLKVARKSAGAISDIEGAVIAWIKLEGEQPHTCFALKLKYPALRNEVVERFMQPITPVLQGQVADVMDPNEELWRVFLSSGLVLKPEHS